MTVTVEFLSQSLYLSVYQLSSDVFVASRDVRIVLVAAVVVLQLDLENDSVHPMQTHTAHTSTVMASNHRLTRPFSLADRRHQAAAVYFPCPNGQNTSDLVMRNKE